MIFRTICTLCEYLDPDEHPDTGLPTCLAFPNGIPDAIFRDGFDHRNEYPDDRGVRFEAAVPVTPEQLDRMVDAARVARGEPDPVES